MRINGLDTREDALGTGEAYFAVDNSESSETEKIDYAALAAAIIAQYNGQTLAGSAQTVKAAFDNVRLYAPQTVLAVGADLNTFLTPGIWFGNTANIKGGLGNAPDGRWFDNTFRFEVIAVNKNANCLLQKITDKLGVIITRYVYGVGTANVVFSEWENLTIASDSKNLVINTLYPDVSAASRWPKMKGDTGNAQLRGTATVAEHGIRGTTSSENWPYYRLGTSNTGSARMSGFEAGETYTLSCDVAWKVLSGSPSASDAYEFGVYLYERTSGSFSQTRKKAIYTYGTDVLSDRGTEKTGRIEFTFTVGSTTTGLYIDIKCDDSNASSYAEGDYVEISNFKIEKGVKATAWTPSPDDIEAAISGVLPPAPTAEGTYTLSVTVDSSGVATYSWISAT